MDTKGSLLVCKSLGEIRNHTIFAIFDLLYIPQPQQQSYDREPGSRYSTHIRAAWGLYILTLIALKAGETFGDF